MAWWVLGDYLQAADRETTVRGYAAAIKHFEQESGKRCYRTTRDPVARYLVGPRSRMGACLVRSWHGTELRVSAGAAARLTGERVDQSLRFRSWSP